MITTRSSASGRARLVAVALGGTVLFGCAKSPEPAPTPIEGLGAAAPLGWDAASQRLFVAVHDGASARIDSLDPLSGQHKLLFRLAPKDPVGVSALGRILVTPDGRAWAYGFLRRLSELYVVEPVRQ